MSWSLVYHGCSFTLDDATRDPFLSGATAFLEGEPRYRCPHSILHPGKRSQWQRGWDEAQRGEIVLHREEEVAPKD